MQAHLRAYIDHPAREEVGLAHPVLECAKHIFDRSAAHSHGIRHSVQPALCSLKHFFMLPAGDTPKLARCALRFHGALTACAAPVAPNEQTILFVAEAVGCSLTRWALTTRSGRIVPWGLIPAAGA